VIIVTAILKVTVLGDHLAKHMWLGVCINFLAMCIVSAPSFFQPLAVGGRDARLGILFIVLSCLVQGSQYVFEEKVMSEYKIPPLIVVGMEGFWGCLMLVGLWPLCYYIPGPDKGSIENLGDALVMLQNSSALLTLCSVFFVSVALYNVFAVFTTHLLNSIWHAILDNFRPVAVWTTDLLIFYMLTHGRFGEPWISASWLQLFGMLVLFFGTAVYNGSVSWLLWKDGIKMEEEEERQELLHGEQHQHTIIHTPTTLSSPYLMRSPLIQRRGSKGTVPLSSSYGATNNR